MRIKPGLEAKVAWLEGRSGETLATRMGVRFTVYDTERTEATMPVGPGTVQPFGLLHGGASVALAESLASVGAWLNVDEAVADVVGMEINANHLRAVTGGTVTGAATPIHRGRNSQVWEIRITDEQDRLVCISRCTLAVIPKRST